MTTPSNLDERIRAAVSELVGAAPPAPAFPDGQAVVLADRASAVTARRHRLGVALVAAALIAVFFVPLPHMNLFNRLGHGAKPPASTLPISGSSCVGTVVPASALSAITFFNDADGLGMAPLSTRRCGARLASTRDGGGTWKLVGARLPGEVGDFSDMATMVFATQSLGWVLGSGALFATRDGGGTWTPVRLGGRVATISLSGSSLWAFVAPCMASPRTCRYRLWSTTVDSTSWHQVGLLPAALGNWSPLVVTRPTPLRALVAIGQLGDTPTIITTDGGVRWSSVRTCAPSGFVAVSFATTGPRGLWAVCLGGGSMSSSLKSLVHSDDGGRTWSVVAVDRNLKLGTPLPVPAEAGEILAVAEPGHLWMATVNLVFGSLDGGKKWFVVPGVGSDGGGTFASFSFVSGTHGWLLEPGRGLWRTTDGRTWRAVKAPVGRPAPKCAAAIPGWTLSAITFFNANDGLGIWSRNTHCGDRLVSTQDGGASWTVTGSELPAPGSAYGQMVFPTPRFGWVFNSNSLFATRNGGGSWSRVQLGGWVTAISTSGSSLWALVSPCNSAVNTCEYPFRLRLEATTFATQSWHEVGLLPELVGAQVSVARLSQTTAVIVETGLRGRTQVFSTSDGGTDWTAVAQPCRALQPNLGSVEAAGGSELLASCLGQASAGESPQALFRSEDAGKSWVAVGIDSGIGAPADKNPIPWAVADHLGAPSADELWMADVNFFHGSLDGGRKWFSVPGIDFFGGGSYASFSFVSEADGWMLDPIVGLWRTTDGRSWRALSLWQRPSPAVDKVPAPGSRCQSTPIQVNVGTVVPASYLASIQFLNALTGVGLTASMNNCSIGQGGYETEAFPVWEVVSSDGGKTWKTVGSALPKALVPSYFNADLAFSSPGRGWIEAGGVLAYTADAGQHWRVVPLGGTVTVLRSSGQAVSALVEQFSQHRLQV
jgi:photosystem II stability/assembly factor-like uncharacterized protein